MFPRRRERGREPSSARLLGSCSQETERGVLGTGTNSAGGGSAILPGDCQTAGAEPVGRKRKKKRKCMSD